MKITSRVSYSWLNIFGGKELSSTCLNVLTGITGNASIPEPYPTYVPTTAQLKADLEDYNNKEAASVNGGKIEVVAKATSRVVLTASFRAVGDYIDKCANGDLATLLSTNYPLQKDRLPLGIQAPPVNLRLKQGKVSGSIVASCDPNGHSVLFEWQTAIGLNPVDWKSETSTTASSSLFDGYPPGTWINVRVRIRVPAGAGDWSGIVQMMVV